MIVNNYKNKTEIKNIKTLELLLYSLNNLSIN